eukprot:gene53309-31441_t
MYAHPSAAAAAQGGFVVILPLIVAQQRALRRADPPPQRHPGALLSLSVGASGGPVAVATMLTQLSLADQSTSGGFTVLGAAAVLFSIGKAAVGALAVYAVPPEAAAAVLFPVQVAEDWVLSLVLLKITPWSVQYFLILIVTLVWDVQRDASLLKALLDMVRRRWCRVPAAVCRRLLSALRGGN